MSSLSSTSFRRQAAVREAVPLVDPGVDPGVDVSEPGRVLVDGNDIRHVTGESLHKQMGLVLQVNYLFSGTVIARSGTPCSRVL